MNPLISDFDRAVRDAHDDPNDYTRPSLYSLISSDITLDQASMAADQVRDLMSKTGLRHIVSVMQRCGTNLNHVNVLIDQPMKKPQAPPEFINGVYISIARVNSLDGFLNTPSFRPEPS